MITRQTQRFDAISSQAYLGLWMHIDISACGDAPCWVYSNENVSGQL